MEALVAAVEALDQAAAMDRGPDAAIAVRDQLGAVLRLVRDDNDDPLASARVTEEDLAYLVTTAEGARWMAESVLDLYDNHGPANAPVRAARPAGGPFGGPEFDPPPPTRAVALDEMWNLLTMDLQTVRSFITLHTAGRSANDEQTDCAHEQDLDLVLRVLSGPPPAGPRRGRQARADGWALAVDAVLAVLGPAPAGAAGPAGASGLPGTPISTA